MHGVNYFGDRRRHWIERVFWIIVFLVSMSACIYTVHKTYTKWQKSPIIVTHDDKLTAISEIPFPAVTVCPSAKVKKLVEPVNLTRTHSLLARAARNKIMALSDTFIGMTRYDYLVSLSEDELEALGLSEDEFSLLEAVGHICPPTESEIDFIENILSPADVIYTLKNNAPKMYDVILERYLKGAYKHKIFEGVFTEEGMCYTFNGLSNFDIFKESS